MRAKVKMTHDHAPYTKGQEFTTSREFADELIKEDVAKEIKVPKPDRSPPEPKTSPPEPETMG